MEHTGTIRMGTEPASTAKTGSVTVTDEHVRATVNGVTIGTWPSIDAEPTGDREFLITAGSNTLVFRPDDYVGFAAEAEALAFRSQFVTEPASEPTAVVTAPPRVPQPAGGVKSAGIAAVLSALWSGLGQIYNGQIVKGLALMALQVFNALLVFVLVGFITGPIVWIWAIYDAYTVADRQAVP